MTSNQTVFVGWAAVAGPAFVLALIGLQFSPLLCALGAIVGMAAGLLTVFVWKPWVKK